MVKVCIINIGNELLLGKTVNTNLSWLGSRLAEIGLPVTRSITIRDEADEIKSALENEWQQHEVVILTGGLGPTKDDITKAVIADFFGKVLEYQPEIWQHITQMFARRGIAIPEINKGQAMVPAGFMALRNDHGTAPGLYYTSENKHFFAMPGVPLEMKYLFDTHISGALSAAFPSKPVVMRTLHTWNVSESALAEKLEGITLPENVQLAWLPQTGRVDLRVYGSDLELVESTRTAIYDIISQNVWGVDEDTPAGVLQDLCINHKLTVAAAESCTGGLAAKLITDRAGASAYFISGVVSYSNAVKVSMLGVKSITLDTYGAVSSETAREMSTGIRAISDASIGLSITGIAGPEGGSDDKPVGTVYFGLDGFGTVHTWKMVFQGDRQSIRFKAAEHGILSAIDFIRSKV